MGVHYFGCCSSEAGGCCTPSDCQVRDDLQVVFILTDNQIIDERFLVYINDMLSTGYIADLCTPVCPPPQAAGTLTVHQTKLRAGTTVNLHRTKPEGICITVNFVFT